MFTPTNRNTGQVKGTDQYLIQRRIPLEIQQRLNIYWVSYEEATSDRYGFGQLATSPDGIIAFPLNREGTVCAAKNWYNTAESQSEHLGYINRYRLNRGLSPENKTPKYLLPHGDRVQDHPFYDPLSLLGGASNGQVHKVLCCTEDVIGAIKAAMAGKRVLSSFGVWLVAREDLENLQADLSWLHPYRNSFPAYLGDSDAHTKVSVYQALIRTGYGLGCPLGLFPLTANAQKVGLDEFLDDDGDLTELVDSTVDVTEFIQRTLPQVQDALEQEYPASLADLKLSEFYQRTIAEIARHIPEFAIFRRRYGDLFKRLGFSVSELRSHYLSVRPNRSLENSPRLLAQALASGLLNQKLLLEGKTKLWYCYREPQHHWEPIPEEVATQQVDFAIEQATGLDAFELRFLDDTKRFFKNRTLVAEWPAVPKLINFSNGVLDLSADPPLLLPHDPEHRLTYCLPRPYVHITNGETPMIDEFQNQLTGGQKGEIAKLNHFAAAVLRGLVELQVYQALIGDPGSGKGTWINFLTELIGPQACYATTLDLFCGNQFDCGNCYGRRLVIFNDADQYNGNLGKFLNFTGGDYVRGEIKGGASFNFRAGGFIILTANRPVFVRSHPGLNRRTVLVHCAKPTGRRPDPTLISKLCDELEPYTARLLELSPEQIQRVLIDRGRSNPRELLLHWRHLCETDAIAAWAEEHLSQGDADSFERIGRFKDDPERLFGSYVQFCHQTGRSPKAVNTFSSGLLYILTEVLGWPVRRDRKRITDSDKPRGFFGVRLRHPHGQTISETLEANLAQFEQETSPPTENS